MKIQYGDESLDVHAVIMVKDKERCLDEKHRIASTQFCPDVSTVKAAMDGGYEPLCFVFSDGSSKFVVKPEQLRQAERIAQAVDRQAFKNMPPQGGVA